VPIRQSSAPQIRRLIDDLRGSDEVRREASVARLAVIGIRAVPHVLAVVDSRDPLPTRMAALRALEAIDDDRVLDVARRRLDDTPDLATAAVSVLKSLLSTRLGAAALDALTATALNATQADGVRSSAVDALTTMPKRTLRPILTRLAKDPSEAIRRKVTESPPATHPSSIRAALAASGSTTPLPTLHRMIQSIRDQEKTLRDGRVRAEWTTTRGAIHRLLASRSSRVALYDLRESIEEADSPLPVEFLAAIAEIGDASCVEPLARAYMKPAAVKRGERDWWRQHLASALRTIVKRERLTKRHSAVKRVLGKWPELERTLF
jgi:HEAT repeat protein